MLQFEEEKLALRALKPELDELASALGIENVKKEVAALEEEAAAPDFWDDTENSQKVLKKTGALKTVLENYSGLLSLYEDAETMLEMAEEDQDEGMLAEINEMVRSLQNGVEAQKLSTLLSGEFDSKMPSSPSTRERAAPRPRTGWRCCTGCTAAGRSATISR